MLQTSQADKIIARDNQLRPLASVNRPSASSGCKWWMFKKRAFFSPLRTYSEPRPRWWFVRTIYANRCLKQTSTQRETTLSAPDNVFPLQWEKEIKKHTNSCLRTYVVHTTRAHAKISYRDVINADVVIVSFTFLK